MSVCLSHPFKLLLFCFSMESSHFWPSFRHVALYKMFLDFFLFRPPNAQNFLPKICTKPPISRLVWQIDRRCLDLPGGFRGWPIQWNHAKCCGADPCCHGNEVCARRGDPVAYQLVCIFVCLCVCWLKLAPLKQLVSLCEKTLSQISDILSAEKAAEWVSCKCNCKSWLYGKCNVNRDFDFCYDQPIFQL